MPRNIMIVDDERTITELVALYLQDEDFVVHRIHDGASALACAKAVSLDLAILDVMLPDISGFELCGMLREKSYFPIIMLTAKDEEIDKITGLTLGADDYVTKPFRPLELVARIKAQLRRYTRYNAGEAVESTDHILTVRGLVMNSKTRDCLLNEAPLSLTPLEFNILWELCANASQVLSSEDIFLRIWGEKYYFQANNTIMVHIRHIREKMGDNAENGKYIKTVRGIGYKVEK